MAIILTIIIFISTASCAYAIAIIMHRQKTLKAIQGQFYASYYSKAKDFMLYLKDNILAANKKLAIGKRYRNISFDIQKLNLENKLTTENFLLLQRISAIAMFIIGLLLCDSVVLGIVAGIFGFFIPQLLLKNKVSEKQELILKELPDAIDIITASIEGGLSLSQAISRYAEEGDKTGQKTKNEFAKEMAVTIKKIQLGKSFEEALTELSARWKMKEMDSFSNIFIQAEKMGGNIKEILRAQAEEMRNKRFQALKKKAYEAPVKLLIPLLLFIFPVVFIVLFGPIVIKLMQGF